MRTEIRFPAACAVVALVVVSMPRHGWSQPPDAPAAAAAAVADSSSSDLAAQLASALEGANLDSIAVKAAEGEDRYVAALRFPTMLLVVSARYEVPMYVDEKLAAGSHRDVYMDLNTASIPGTKVLITDTGANGLRVGEAGDSADVEGTMLRYDAGSPQHDEANVTYVGMLQALLSAAP